MFLQRHYIVFSTPLSCSLNNTTDHFKFSMVILPYCLNFVSSCLYIIPLFSKNQVQFNQIQKKSFRAVFPKRFSVSLSIFSYFSLFSSLFSVNLRTIVRHARRAIRFGSTIKPLNISAISHTRSTFKVEPMMTQITTITA